MDQVGSRPSLLQAKALRLEYLTIAWMSIEAMVALISGIAAGSVALTAFGLDSVVELGAAGVVIWQFRGVTEEREHLAHRLIAVSLYALAAYVTADSFYTLVNHGHPENSPAGIAVTVAALIIMPLLARAKKRTGEEMGNAALVADSSESSLCAYLSAVALAGLLLNSLFGWWWADPVAALGIAAFAISEGREAWEGDHCG
jgi:divalent metal cation (Fe/Co/Zn/Cd) transporter